MTITNGSEPARRRRNKLSQRTSASDGEKERPALWDFWANFGHSAYIVAAAPSAGRKQYPSRAAEFESSSSRVFSFLMLEEFFQKIISSGLLSPPLPLLGRALSGRAPIAVFEQCSRESCRVDFGATADDEQQRRREACSRCRQPVQISFPPRHSRAAPMCFVSFCFVLAPALLCSAGSGATRTES